MPDPTVSNILGRISGGNPSSIFGTIDSLTYYPNANLFLLNPAGFIFGPTTAVNVGGMVAFTTADYLRLANNVLFNAVPNATADALLSTAPVAAYGFLGSNPRAITVQGSQFTVTNGQTISLVGGNIAIGSGTPDGGTAQPAHLSAPNGNILLASAASPGEFGVNSLQSLLNVDGSSFTSFGKVSLAQDSNFNISGDNTVSIRGGQFILSMNNAVLSTADSVGSAETIVLSPGSAVILSTANAESGADIQLAASSVDIDGALILSSVSPSDFVADRTDGPPITLNVDNLNIRGGGAIVAESVDIFAALQPIFSGTITINATDTVTVSGSTPISPGSRIESRTDGGALGNIIINAKNLLVTQGARVNSDASFGQAGQILINASDSVTVAHGGKVRMDTSFSTGGLIDITASSIEINQATIQTRTVAEGDAGAVHLHGDNITIAGGQINSQTDEGLGRGGNVTLDATQNISIIGRFEGNSIDPAGRAGLFTTTANQGAPGGNIALTAGQSITISDGASVSASSTGPGNAGNININAGNQFTMTNSTVTTEAKHASGGNIDIRAVERVHLVNSTISASVADGSGGGGNISIDPQFVILQNSQILAQAAQGQGGAITITANLFLADGNSIVNADSGSGVNGTVTIQSPNAPISGQIHPLGKTPLLATTLLTQQCASVAGGQFSSFTVAGRNSLPTEPGNWLASPLYAEGMGRAEGLSGLSGVSDVVRTGLVPHQINQTNQIDKTDQSPLSLRQIAPAGFLTRSFAVDRSAGCTS